MCVCVGGVGCGWGEGWRPILKGGGVMKGQEDKNAEKKVSAGQKERKKVKVKGMRVEVLDGWGSFEEG